MNSDLVYPGISGALEYCDYSDRGDRIPDFASCGYRGLFPSPAQLKHVLSPAASGDDTQRIQEVIDDIERQPRDATGFRGVVLLKKGRYRVSQPLKITASGVILRGEGEGNGGTTLTAVARQRGPLISVFGPCPPFEVAETRREIVDEYLPVGSLALMVANASCFTKGDCIRVSRNGNAEWIRAISMDRIESPKKRPRRTVKQWQPFRIQSDRVVTAVDGMRIALDAPVVCAVDAKWGGGDVVRLDDPRIEQVGIENLRGTSEFDRNVTACLNGSRYFADEQHASWMVHFENVKNAWARYVVARNFCQGMTVIGSGCKWITVRNCASADPVSLIDAGRRYAFYIAGGQQCLIRECQSSGARHAFVVGCRVSGPNVFLDCRSKREFGSSEPHERWSVGGLYDNVVGSIAIQDRQWMGTGHGWAGANYIAWNCEGSLVCQKPPTAQNFAIGFVGAKATGSFDRQPGCWESEGRHVEPRSLYLQQVADQAVRQSSLS